MLKDHRIAAYLLLLGAALLLAAGFLGQVPPPTAPLATARQVAAAYGAHHQGILIFALLNCLAVTLTLPYFCALSLAMLRTRPKSYYLAILQSVGSLFASIGPFLASLFFAAAAVRADSPPAVLAVLNDLGVMFIELSTLPALFQGFAVAVAIFRDRSERPVLPRWLAWTGILWSILAQGGVTSVFFDSGPFSPSGVIGIVLPMISLFVWFIAAAVALLLIPRDVWREIDGAA